LSQPSVGEDPEFTKSTFSGEGNCLEVAHVGGWVLLRNSRFPDVKLPKLTLDEWNAFRLGVQNGEFCFD
jgi:Domain of unknown function (DUF397)